MKNRACEIVCNILKTWPNISIEDIVAIREIVLKKKFAGAAGLSDDGLVTLVGETFQEIRFLHTKLGITFDNVAADKEMWYISEWLKENRINDRRVRESSIKELACFLGTIIYEYAEETRKGELIWKKFLDKANDYTIK